MSGHLPDAPELSSSVKADQMQRALQIAEFYSRYGKFPREYRKREITNAEQALENKLAVWIRNHNQQFDAPQLDLDWRVGNKWRGLSASTMAAIKDEAPENRKVLEDLAQRIVDAHAHLWDSK